MKMTAGSRSGVGRLQNFMMIEAPKKIQRKVAEVMLKGNR